MVVVRGALSLVIVVGKFGRFWGAVHHRGGGSLLQKNPAKSWDKTWQSQRIKECHGIKHSKAIR